MIFIRFMLSPRIRWRVFFSIVFSGVSSLGSFSIRSTASSRDSSSSLMSRNKFPALNKGIPDWRVPVKSPGPRIRKSSSAMANPSRYSTIALSLAFPFSVKAWQAMRRHFDAHMPLPTRPRSW